MIFDILNFGLELSLFFNKGLKVGKESSLLVNTP